MAPTRPATNGPIPKSAPTTENNGIKKTSKPAEQQLYIVTRETNDPEGTHDNHEVVGSFKTLAAANAAARDDLIRGWGRDYFDTYEASEVDGMAHVIATCPDGEEMVVMVEKSVKKVSPPPKAVKQHTYTVTRETIDPYHCHDNLEIIGTYDSLAAANSVARSNMVDEWGTDYFETFEVDEVDGMVRVDAMCPDGENMIVLVEETDVKTGTGKGAVSSVTRTTNEEPGLIAVYHVIQETIDYHNDRHGGAQNTAVKGTYVSLEKANEAARKELLQEWDMDFFEEYDEGMANGLVTINAICPKGEHMNVYVKRGTLITDREEMAGLVKEMLAEMDDESEDGSEEE
ncbi:hypothetical protein V491_07704 [Pseudogymnoascus sp. VKM F-3775]|nr:hypothetical protein V491_07704 [Pseudogymnoascus sp. VKM F-3775]